MGDSWVLFRLGKLEVLLGLAQKQIDFGTQTRGLKRKAFIGSGAAGIDEVAWTIYLLFREKPHGPYCFRWTSVSSRPP